MSASSHSRGHRYAPENTKKILTWLENHNRRIINNSKALTLEISKQAQYRELENYNIRLLEIDENNSYILNHLWKGNVRELRNLIERIAILQPDNKEKISNIIMIEVKIFMIYF